MSEFACRLVRPLLGILVVGLVGPAAALADYVNLATGSRDSNGIPATVTASGMVNSQGRVTVFRLTGYRSTCPSYSVANYQAGVNLSGPNGHAITETNNFSFSDDNTVGTQTTGTTYSLCGVLQPDSGTPTISAPAQYTTSGPPPPPPGNAPPTATTGPATGFGELTGTLTTNGGETTYGFDYGPTSAYGQHVNGGAPINAGNPSATVSAAPSLAPGTFIHYRLVATNGKGTGYGGDRTYLKPGGTAEVTTGAATAVGGDGFTLNGTYIPHGHYAAYFEYMTGIDSELTAMLPVPPDEDAGSVNVARAVVPGGFDTFFGDRFPECFGSGQCADSSMGVPKRLTITYRLVVGGTRGAWRTVTTPVPTRSPSVTTGGAEPTRCEFHCIALHGTVNEHGQGYAYIAFEVGLGKTGSLGRRFCYAGHYFRHAVDPSSTTPVNVSGRFCQTLSAPGTVVHYRLDAANGTGEIIRGAERTYTVPGGASKKTILTAITGALTPKGKAAKIAAILKAKGYPAKFTAPSAGTATIAWYQVPKGAHVAKAKKKPVLVAKGTKKTTKKGKTVVKVKLTKKGKALLKKVKKHHKLKLTTKGTFKPKGGKTVSKKKAISLKR